jgi:hypothetical protein
MDLDDWRRWFICQKETEVVHRERDREPVEVKVDVKQVPKGKISVRVRAGIKAIKGAAEEAADRAKEKEAAGKESKNFRKGGIVMPGFDGKGPMGAGPLTGRGRGRCNSADVVYGRGFFRNRGLSAGMGYGGMGYGPGFGRRGGWNESPYGSSQVNTVMEIDALKAEAVSMKNALEMINREISNLEKKAAKVSTAGETDD